MTLIERLTKEDMDFHPLCTFFPRITGDEFDALVADIAANGLREPIVLLDGMVLDGGNRYAACLAAGKEPHFVGFTGGDPVAFVLSANLHRRHLTAGQHAAIVASVTNWADANKRGGRRATDANQAVPLATVADRAKASGTSERTQRTADKVAREAPELVEKVAQGEISLRAAVETLNEGKPKSSVRAETDEAAAIAAEDFDPLAELESTSQQLAEIQSILAAVQSDSPQGEILKLRRQVKAMESEAARNAEVHAETKKKANWRATQLKRIGRAVGEDDEAKIADAVEKALKATA